MTKESKTIVNTSFITFMYEVEEAIKEGFSLSHEYSPAFNFVVYEAFLERDAAEKPVQDVAEAPKKVGRPVKDKQ